MFQPSPYQSAIFTALRERRGNLCVRAVAGSGKTTTIVQALRVIPQRDPDRFTTYSTLFLAFNKTIAEALRSKCPSHVQCSTFHALALRALKRVLGPEAQRKDFIDSRKVAKLVFSLTDRDDPDASGIMRLVGLTKSVPREPSSWSDSDLADLAARYELSFDEPRSAWHITRSVAERSYKERQFSIDFDDMLFLAVMLNAPFDQQDYIFVDEAQDTNDIQIEILDRLYRRSAPQGTPSVESVISRIQEITPSSLLCAVGDPAQAIYGFRGANADSMDRIASRFAAEWYPLSVSYRCSLAVVEEANRILEKETL